MLPSNRRSLQVLCVCIRSEHSVPEVVGDSLCASSISFALPSGVDTFQLVDLVCARGRYVRDV